MSIFGGRGFMRCGQRHANRFPVQTAQLFHYIHWVSYLVFGFAFFEGIVFVLSGDAAEGLTSLILLSYGGLLLAARALTLKGHVKIAVPVLCFGHLAATLVAVPIRPDLAPALILTPLLSVAVALTHTGDRVLRVLSVVAWLVAVVAAYGNLGSTDRALWPWYGSAFSLVSFGTTAAAVLIFLWQFRKRLVGALMEAKAAEERYALAERGTNDGLWDWDLLSNSFYLSPRWKEMVGCTEHQIGSSPEEWFGRVHPEDRSEFESEIKSSLEGTEDSFEKEYRVLHEDGGSRWVLNRGLIVRDKSGRALRMVGAQTDITRRKHIEEQLLYQATHDALTGLLNRASLEERLSKAIERSVREEGYQFSVLFLDLDRFKNVNDSLGHAVGDLLLVATAKRLKRCVNPTDTISRLGGDEFAILLDSIDDAEEATRRAHRIQQEISKPFELHGHELFSTVSIGIVHQPGRYDLSENLLRDADIAMYRAKDLGRARHELFEVDMHSKIVSRLNLETDLRRAVEKEEFLVHYQPIVSLDTGGIVAFEALVRWQHPQRGMVSPNDFIPLAEETGLIVPIGLQVLREACLQMRSWQFRFPDRLPLTVDVNLSGVQLTQPDLLSQLTDVLRETGIDGRLRLEITESTIARDEELATETLAQMRKLNVHTHIDDFGTGYSSLGTLHRFPVQGLKIDRSFVSRMRDIGDDTEIVQTITTLAHNLGMDVVAEGVETAAQLARLRSMGCDYAQGYFFSKPVDGTAAGELLEAEPRW